MDPSYQHKILIVDNNDHLHKITDQISQDTDIEFVFTKTCRSALKIVKESPNVSFPVIIAEQNLPEIKGTDFFKKVQQKYPHTSFFLMADRVDIDIVTAAVNQGLIQRYLSKPTDPAILSKAIKSGIKIFNALQDNDRLIQLAKQQNTQLYELNCELMETTKAHNKTILDIDKEIEVLETAIKEIENQPPVKADILSAQIAEQIMDKDRIDTERLQTLFNQTIQALHLQFTELAYRNGFDISPVTGDKK